jgi:hypothetical protein
MPGRELLNYKQRRACAPIEATAKSLDVRLVVTDDICSRRALKPRPGTHLSLRPSTAPAAGLKT